MRNFACYLKIFLMVSALCLANAVNAQEAQATEKPAPANVAPAKETKKAAPDGDKTTRKMVQDATINLQTTVTGNQEQPRVLYILPWQSPAPEDVDFESFSNDQRDVFGHVEREELRRELEAAGE